MLEHISLLFWPEANVETSVDHSAKPYEYEGSMPLVLHQTIIERSHRVLYVIYDMCTVGTVPDCQIDVARNASIIQIQRLAILVSVVSALVDCVSETTAIHRNAV